MTTIDIISDYRLVRDTATDRLGRSVQGMIEKGWQPFCGPFSSGDGPALLIQAVVRRGEAGAYVRDLRLEGVRLLQTRLLDLMRGGSLEPVAMLQAVLSVESELEDNWKRLNEPEVKIERHA